jgi:putative tryptophan/tyrosine transport system substrate-binding protein
MNKSVFRFALGAMLLALTFVAEAQQPAKVPRIGYVTSSSLSAFAARTEAFRQGLRELGYVEGKNIAIKYRYGDAKTDRLNQLTGELVRLINLKAAKIPPNVLVRADRVIKESAGINR